MAQGGFTRATIGVHERTKPMSVPEWRTSFKWP